MSDDKLYKIAQRISNSTNSGFHSRTAGTVEFKKDQGPVRRDVRVKNFDFSPDSLRNLAKTLWAFQRAHSYAMTGYRILSKMPSADFSPDGLLGGRGYIQGIPSMRKELANAIEVFSSASDTLHDEINADHWKTAEEAAPTVQPMMDDAEQVKANPEGFVQEEFSEVAPGEMNPDASEMNPFVEGEEEEEESDEASQGFAQMSTDKPKAELPTDESEQEYGLTEVEALMHTTIPARGNYARTKSVSGDSSIPQSTLPGPRITDIAPGSTENGYVSDDPMGPGLDGSGTNMTDPIYEEWCADGVSGYEDPTDGDSTVLKFTSMSQLAGYSWLPGSDNAKNFDYYKRGLTEADIEWMRAHSAPDTPKGLGGPTARKPRKDIFWEALRS